MLSTLRTKKSRRRFSSAPGALQAARVVRYLWENRSWALFTLPLKNLCGWERKTHFRCTLLEADPHKRKHSFLPLLLFRHSLDQLRLLVQKSSDLSWHSQALPFALTQAVYYAMIIFIQPLKHLCVDYISSLQQTSWAKKGRAKNNLPKRFQTINWLCHFKWHYISWCSWMWNQIVYFIIICTLQKQIRIHKIVKS